MLRVASVSFQAVPSTAGRTDDHSQIILPPDNEYMEVVVNFFDIEYDDALR